MSTYPTGDVFCITTHTDRATLDLSYPSGSWDRLPERVQIVPADAVVIRRDDLPEVTEDPDSSGFARIGDGTYSLGHACAWYRLRAMNLLALAEWKDAHPPQDEAQVAALAEDMCAAHRTPISDAQIEACIPDARRLIALGWSKAGVTR